MVLESENIFPSKRQQKLENILVILTILMIFIGITFIYLGIKNAGVVKESQEIDPVKGEILNRINEIEVKIGEIKEVMGEGR